MIRITLIFSRLTSYLYYYNYFGSIYNNNLKAFMFSLVLKARFSQVYKKKDFSAKYVVYDDLIKNYNISGVNLDTSTMKKFLFEATPKVSRQHNYTSKLS